MFKPHLHRSAVYDGERIWQLFAQDHDSYDLQKIRWFLSVIWKCFALPNVARGHKRRFVSPHYSNYFLDSVAACLQCTSQTEVCTVYVMIFYVPLLLHNNGYSFFARPVYLNPRLFA